MKYTEETQLKEIASKSEDGLLEIEDYIILVVSGKITHYVKKSTGKLYMAYEHFDFLIKTDSYEDSIKTLEFYEAKAIARSLL